MHNTQQTKRGRGSLNEKKERGVRGRSPSPRGGRNAQSGVERGGQKATRNSAELVHQRVRKERIRGSVMGRKEGRAESGRENRAKKGGDAIAPHWERKMRGGRKREV